MLAELGVFGGLQSRGKSRGNIRLSSSFSFLLLMNFFLLRRRFESRLLLQFPSKQQIFSPVVCYDIFVCPATLPAGLEQWTDGSKLTSLDRSSSRGDCALWRPRWVVVLTSLVSVVFVMFFTHYCCTLMHPHQLVQAHPTLMPSLCHSSNETAPSCSYSLVVIASHLIHHTYPN